MRRICLRFCHVLCATVLNTLSALHLDRVHAHLNRLEWFWVVSLDRLRCWKQSLIFFILPRRTDMLSLEDHLLRILCTLLAILVLITITTVIVLIIHISFSLCRFMQGQIKLGQ